MMQFTPDFTICGDSGELLAIIEVKNKRNPTNEWAKKLHDSFFPDLKIYPNNAPKYFLLVTPENTYIWNHEKNDSSQRHSAEVMIFKSSKLFKDRLHFDLSNISGPAFEMIVSDWLSTNESMFHDNIFDERTLQKNVFNEKIQKLSNNF